MRTHSICCIWIGRLSYGLRSFSRRLLLPLAVTLLAITSTRAASGDEHWDTAFGNTLYLGGLFTTLNGVFVNQFAAWDGIDFQPVGSPGRINGLYSLSARALATDGTNLYAGGTFTYAGQVLANRVARWDGASWHALGSGITYPGFSSASVAALVASGSDLYVGGIFGAAGGKPAMYIAHWNDTYNFDQPPALELSKLRRAGNSFKFAVTAANVPSYIIEATTNFSSWTALDTNTAAFYESWDLNVGSYPRRFYRARSGP